MKHLDKVPITLTEQAIKDYEDLIHRVSDCPGYIRELALLDQQLARLKEGLKIYPKKGEQT